MISHIASRYSLAGPALTRARLSLFYSTFFSFFFLHPNRPGGIRSPSGRRLIRNPISPPQPPTPPPPLFTPCPRTSNSSHSQNRGEVERGKGHEEDTRASDFLFVAWRLRKPAQQAAPRPSRSRHTKPPQHRRSPISHAAQLRQRTKAMWSPHNTIGTCENCLSDLKASQHTSENRCRHRSRHATATLNRRRRAARYSKGYRSYLPFRGRGGRMGRRKAKILVPELKTALKEQAPEYVLQRPYGL